MAAQPKGKEAAAAQAAKLIAGTQQILSTVPEVTVGGVKVPTAQIVAQLQELITLRAAVDASKAAAEAAVQAENAQTPALYAFMAEYVASVRTLVGNAATALAPFGLVPKKARVPLTVEEKAAAVAKREATREARHTMGPKARLAIKGDVVGVQVTPLVEPPATAEATSPAALPTAAPKATSHTA